MASSPATARSPERALTRPATGRTRRGHVGQGGASNRQGEFLRTTGDGAATEAELAAAVEVLLDRREAQGLPRWLPDDSPALARMLASLPADQLEPS